MSWQFQVFMVVERISQRIMPIHWLLSVKSTKIVIMALVF